MAGRVLLILLSPLSAALVMGVKDNFVIKIEVHSSTPHIQLLNQQLDCVGNNDIIEKEIVHNRGLRHVHRRLIEEHLQQAMDHVHGSSAAYAPFFEFPMDIIIPSDDDTDNVDHKRRSKQSLQQRHDIMDNERFRQHSGYERALKIQKIILSSDITIVTTTMPYANSISFLYGTKWQTNSPPLPSIAPRKCQLKCTKLDDVCTTFSACLKGDEVDTAQLIEACKAHLVFMKSGGNSLRLVAKDLESNLQKAEKPFQKSPKQGKTLSSLLEREREAGIHNGSKLKEQSAAMGLLWIRRSLAFQLELYASLIDQDGPHPRDAAYEAYIKHLSPFHGWTLRKLFPASLSQIPDRQALIAQFGEVTLDELNEEYDSEVVTKLRSLVKALGPLLSTWERDFVRLDLEDIRRV